MKIKLCLFIFWSIFLISNICGCISSDDNHPPKENRQLNSNWDNMNWDNNSWAAEQSQPIEKTTSYEIERQNHILNNQTSPEKVKFVQQCIQYLPDNLQKNQTIETKEINNAPTKSLSDINIEITKMPPVGNRIQNIEGRVYPFDTRKHKIQIAIWLNEEWIKKPGNNRNYGMTINKLGEFSCDITTAPGDHLSKKIGVFIFPSSTDISTIDSLTTHPCLGMKFFDRE